MIDLTISITRKTRNLEKLINKLEAIDGKTIEAGYFYEQGEHPEAEMPYVELAMMHAEGDGNFPARSVLPITGWRMKSSEFKSNVAYYLSQYLFSSVSPKRMFDNIATDISDIAVSHFGQIGPTMAPNSPMWSQYKANEIGYDGGPLVYEGFLKDAWSFRHDFNPNIVNFNG